MDKKNNLQSKLKEKGKDNLYLEYRELNDTLSKYEKDYARAKGLKSVLDETASGLIEGQVDENTFEIKLKDVGESTAEWLNEVNEEKSLFQIIEILTGMGISEKELKKSQMFDVIKKYSALPAESKIDVEVFKDWFYRIDTARKPIIETIDKELNSDLYFYIYNCFLEGIEGNADISYQNYIQAVDYLLKARTNWHINRTGQLFEKFDSKHSDQVFTKYMEVMGLIDQALFNEEFDLSLIKNSRNILTHKVNDLLKKGELIDSDLEDLDTTLNRIVIEVLNLPSTDLNLISLFDSIGSKFARNGLAFNEDEYIKKYLSSPAEKREDPEIIYSKIKDLFALMRRSVFRDPLISSEIFTVFDLYCRGENKEAFKAYKILSEELLSYEKQTALNKEISEAFTGRNLSLINENLQLQQSLSDENTRDFYESFSRLGYSEMVPFIEIEEITLILKDRGIILGDILPYIEKIDFHDFKNVNPGHLNSYIAERISDFLLESQEFNFAEEFSNKLFALGFQKIGLIDSMNLINFLAEHSIDYKSALALAENLSSSMNFKELSLTSSEFLNVFATYALELKAGNAEVLKSAYYALQKFSARRNDILKQYNQYESELRELSIELKNSKSEDNRIRLKSAVNERVFNMHYQRTALIRNQIQLDLANQYILKLDQSVPSTKINNVLNEFINLNVSADIKFIAKKYNLELPDLMSTLEIQEIKTHKSLHDFSVSKEIYSNKDLRDIFLSLGKNPEQSLDPKQKEKFLDIRENEMNDLENLFSTARTRVVEGNDILDHPENYTYAEIDAYKELLLHYYGLANQIIGKASDVELLYTIDASDKKVYLNKNIFEKEGNYSFTTDTNGLDLVSTVKLDKTPAIEKAKHGLLRIDQITGGGQSEYYSSLNIRPTEFQLNLLFGEIKPDIEKIGAYSDRLKIHEENLSGIGDKLKEASDSKIPLWHGGVVDDPVQEAFDDSIDYMDGYIKELVNIRQDLLYQRDNLRQVLASNDEFFEQHPQLIQLKEIREKSLRSAIEQFDYYINNPSSPFSLEMRREISGNRGVLNSQKIEYLRGAAFDLASMSVIIAVTVASAGAASALTGSAATALGASASTKFAAILVSSSAAMTVGMRGGQYVSDMVEYEGQSISNYQANNQIDWSAWGLYKDFSVNMVIMAATMGGATLAGKAISKLASKSTKLTKIAEAATRQRHVLPASSKLGARISRAGETVFFRGGTYLSKESSEELVQESAQRANPVLGFLLAVAMGTRINRDIEIPGVNRSPAELGISTENGKPVYDTPTPENFISEIKQALLESGYNHDIDYKINSRTGVIDINYKYKDSVAQETSVELSIAPSKESNYKKLKKLYQAVYSVEGAKIDKENNKIMFPEGTELTDYVSVLRERGFTMIAEEGKLLLKHYSGIKMQTNLEQNFETLVPAIDGIEVNSKTGDLEINDPAKFFDIVNKLQFLGLIPMKTEQGFKVSDGVNTMDIKISENVVSQIDTDFRSILENIDKMFELYESGKNPEEYTSELKKYIEHITRRFDKYNINYGMGGLLVLGSATFNMPYILGAISLCLTAFAVSTVVLLPIESFIDRLNPNKMLDLFIKNLDVDTKAVKDLYQGNITNVPAQTQLITSFNEMRGAYDRLYNLRWDKAFFTKHKHYKRLKDAYNNLMDFELYERIRNTRKRLFFFKGKGPQNPRVLNEINQDLDVLENRLFILNNELQALGYGSSRNLGGAINRPGHNVSPNAPVTRSRRPYKYGPSRRAPRNQRQAPVGQARSRDLISTAARVTKYTVGLSAVAFLLWKLYEEISIPDMPNVVDAAKKGVSDAGGEESEKLEKEDRQKFDEAKGSKRKIFNPSAEAITSGPQFSGTDPDEIINGILELDESKQEGKKISPRVPEPLPMEPEEPFRIPQEDLPVLQYIPPGEGGESFEIKKKTDFSERDINPNFDQDKYDINKL